MILFVVDHMTKEGMGPVLKGITPYFQIFAVFLILLLVFPELATRLPSRM
jgi:TRAP-type C4-dicarboxylate transport system permease large subunit